MVPCKISLIEIKNFLSSRLPDVISDLPIKIIFFQ